ncbi:MAG: GGDEF domain-containing response regulator [Acidimicrobiia bacterium]
MGSRILVVDDDTEVAAAVEVNLVVEGYDVRVVHDGAAALLAVRDFEPELVILDVVLPTISGVEVCEALRADPRSADIAVIMLTAKTVKEDRLRGLSAGADDYLLKPFDPAELVARVRNVLRRSSRMRDQSPLTRLPGNFSISAELERLVNDADARFAVLYCDLNHFKSFNDHYGFLRGDEVIKFTAQVCTDSMADVEGTPHFVGHVGGDDFVVICPPEVAEALAATIIERFDAGIPNFYDEADRALGYVETVSRTGDRIRNPLMGIAIGVATTERRRLATQWEASVAASEMKSHAKRHGRSAFEVDRRQS